MSGPASRWTPDQRAEAMALFVEVGPAEASRRTGIPKGTIASWGHRSGTKTHAVANTAAANEASRLRWEERRLELADRIGAVAEKALVVTEAAIDAGHGRNAKDAATTMAILVDKAQLLSGGSTSRATLHEVREEVIASAREGALRLVR